LTEALAGTVLATCRITFAEVRSAIARREREMPAATDFWAQARKQFADDWLTFQLVEVQQPLVEKAADYADVFGLRAYDAVQLAAAAVLHEGAPGGVIFRAFDVRLNRAARQLGLALPPGEPG
jgi:uncharacterized protein